MVYIVGTVLLAQYFIGLHFLCGLLDKNAARLRKELARIKEEYDIEIARIEKEYQ